MGFHSPSNMNSTIPSKVKGLIPLLHVGRHQTYALIAEANPPVSQSRCLLSPDSFACERSEMSGVMLTTVS